MASSNPVSPSQQAMRSTGHAAVARVGHHAAPRPRSLPGRCGTPPEPERPGQDPRHRPGPRTRAPALAPCPVTSDGASASKIAWQASELPELRQKPLIRWLCTCDTRKHSPPLPRTPLTCSHGPDSHRATAGSVPARGPGPVTQQAFLSCGNSTKWSYGDSNPRPLACHADSVRRSASEGVERGATHLQELSDWVAVSLRVPEYAGSRFWLPCLAVHDHGETVSTYPGALLGSSPARPWPPAAASRRSPATRNYRCARHARRRQHPRLKTRPARRPDPRVSAGRVR
jgi:hypothetical protein